MKYTKGGEGNMQKKIMLTCLKGKALLQNAVNNFMKKEKGASDMVAVIVLIVIVVALAAVFRTQLKGVIEKGFQNVTTFISNPNG